MSPPVDKLTEQGYWESGYRERETEAGLPDVEDFRQLPIRRMIETLESVDLDGKKVLEVGAGDSTILLMLAQRFAGRASFAGLDYTDTGCDLLRQRAGRLGVDVSVLQADLFQPPADLIGGFDVVYSIGLVEHFERLDDVLVALKRFLKPGGTMVTIIPNMHGVVGALTKRWNRSVYELHNPHGLVSFLAGHAGAKLDVMRSGYLCSNNFCVLSSCFDKTRGRKPAAYLALVCLTLSAWWLESRTFELPIRAGCRPTFFRSVGGPTRMQGDLA